MWTTCAYGKDPSQAVSFPHFRSDKTRKQALDVLLVVSIMILPGMFAPLFGRWTVVMQSGAPASLAHSLIHCSNAAFEVDNLETEIEALELEVNEFKHLCTAASTILYKTQAEVKLSFAVALTEPVNDLLSLQAQLAAMAIGCHGPPMCFAAVHPQSPAS